MNSSFGREVTAVSVRSNMIQEQVAEGSTTNTTEMINLLASETGRKQNFCRGFQIFLIMQFTLPSVILTGIFVPFVFLITTPQFHSFLRFQCIEKGCSSRKLLNTFRTIRPAQLYYKTSQGFVGAMVFSQQKGV